MTRKDWRAYCSPIRDQGQCGSCSVFGTIGSWEANQKIKKNENIDLSERDLFACSFGTCEGGNTMDNVLKRGLKGVATEKCCPYVPKTSYCGEGRCYKWWETGYKLNSWETIEDIKEMKKRLSLKTLVGVMAVHESFLHYKEGVYHSLGEEDQLVGYHCISIVGFDDDKEAWLLRNSWSEDWGMKGYCWIKYRDSEIDQVMYSLKLSDERPSPDEPICPVSRKISKIPIIGWSLLKGLRKLRKFFFGIEEGNP